MGFAQLSQAAETLAQSDDARGGLLLGYAAYPPEAIRTGVRTLAAAASLVRQEAGMPR
jgi:DNA-binding transcriptional MocR family regulator